MTERRTSLPRKLAHRIIIEVDCQKKLPVPKARLTAWAKQTLENTLDTPAEVTIRFIDKEDMQTYNRTYRSKDKPTNVLAFPMMLPAGVVLKRRLLGDMLICPDVLAEEATTQQIPLHAHWAHIVTHGLLHLLGYDHEIPCDEKKMQAKETECLIALGFPNPYKDADFV